MKPYPKNVYKTTDLIQKYKNAGLVISDNQKVEEALNEIGFYRLRGYSFHLYDSNAKKYLPNVSFDTICHIYNFDMELRSLLFGMTCKVEVALRSRFCEALLQKNDALIYLDPSIFKDKAIFWRNTSTLSSEIARSTDVFITHNYDNHDGQIPLWAAVEVMSFGTLSKYIKNLSTGKGSVYPDLAQFYKYTSAKGNLATPSLEMLSSWIHAVVVLRNICAHNSRIYNRSLTTKPTLLSSDQQTPAPRYCGLYHFLLSMKYLRPSDSEWADFTTSFDALLTKYQNDIDLGKLHLPADWKNHI